MSDSQQSTSNPQNVHFNTRINVYGTVIIFAGGLFSLLAMFIIAVFSITHWSSFVAITAWVVYSILALVSVLAIVGIAWLAIHLYGRFIDVQGARMRSHVLHTDTHYAIVEIEGQVEVIPISQEKVTYHVRQQSPESIVESDEPQYLPSPMQSFHDLLMDGTAQRAISQGKMILGYAGDSLRYGSWLDLYSCAIGGVTGSGKTTTVRFLLFQAVMAGARLLMVDPHIEEEEESLAAQFRLFPLAHLYKPCGDSPNEVLKRVRWLTKELARRKSQGSKTPFVIFVVDEFNAVMRIKEVREEMASLLVSMAQEGRKFGLFAMLIGQRWAHQDIGGADIRSSLASTLAHRFTDEAQAKLLLGGRNGARCLDLSTGHYLFRDTSGGISEMITPYTGIEDGAIIQGLLDNRGMKVPTSTNRYPTSERGEVPTTDPLPLRLSTQGRKPLEASLGLVEVDNTKAEQVFSLLREKKGQNEIIEQVWGCTGGRAYQSALVEFRAIVAHLVEKGV